MICIISATNRPGNLTRHISAYLQAEARARNAECRLLDLRMLPPTLMQPEAYVSKPAGSSIPGQGSVWRNFWTSSSPSAEPWKTEAETDPDPGPWYSSPMRRTLLLLALLPALMPVACHHVDGDVVAKVGSEAIRIKAFQDYLSSVSGQSWEMVESRVASRMLDQYLKEESVFLSANTNRGHIPEDPGRRWHLLRQIVHSSCGPAPTPSPETVEVALKKKGTQQAPEMVLIRQLMLPNEAAARAVRKRLDEGEDFEALSRANSIAPNASRAGALGWVPRGTQPDEIEKVVFSLKKDEISQPVEGPGGYHLFQLLDRREAGPRSPEDLRDETFGELKTEAERRHFHECIDHIVNTAGVTVFPRHLWFEYSGELKEDFDEN